MIAYMLTFVKGANGAQGERWLAGKWMNDRQKRFVEEYLVDFNATQAAIRAGYSPKTAYSIGNENLKKPENGFWPVFFSKTVLPIYLLPILLTLGYFLYNHFMHAQPCCGH